VTVPPLAGELLTVVIRGDFSPLNLSPNWLRKRELIGEAEAQQIKYDLLIPNEASVFQAAWVRCLVQRETLELQTQQQAESERLRDLAVGILKASPDVAISALGINRNVHFAVSNVKQWHAIGDHLVNNDIWSGLVNNPGMRSVIYWGGRLDNYAGRIQIQIEPSMLLQPGIYVAYNDHYDLTTVKSQPTTRQEAQNMARPEDTDKTTEKISIGIDVLTSNWQATMDSTTAVIERIWEQAG
jgi:hypothetical protein